MFIKTLLCPSFAPQTLYPLSVLLSFGKAIKLKTRFFTFLTVFSLLVGMVKKEKGCVTIPICKETVSANLQANFTRIRPKHSSIGWNVQWLLGRCTLLKNRTEDKKYSPYYFYVISKNLSVCIHCDCIWLSPMRSFPIFILTVNDESINSLWVSPKKTKVMSFQRELE